jgi:hypothetical protein
MIPFLLLAVAVGGGVVLGDLAAWVQERQDRRNEFDLAESRAEALQAMDRWFA